MRLGYFLRSLFQVTGIPQATTEGGVVNYYNFKPGAGGCVGGASEMSAEKVVVPHHELAERIMPLLQEGGALAHLVYENESPPSQSVEVLALLAKRYLEMQNLDLKACKPSIVLALPEKVVESQVILPRRMALAPGTATSALPVPCCAPSQACQDEMTLELSTGQSTESSEEVSANEDPPAPEGEGDTETKLMGRKSTVKRRQQRKRAKEKQVAESSGEFAQDAEYMYLSAVPQASYHGHMAAVSNGWEHMVPAPPHAWTNPYMYGGYVGNNWYATQMPMMMPM